MKLLGCLFWVCILSFQTGATDVYAESFKIKKNTSIEEVIHPGHTERDAALMLWLGEFYETLESPFFAWLYYTEGAHFSEKHHMDVHPYWFRIARVDMKLGQYRQALQWYHYLNLENLARTDRAWVQQQISVNQDITYGQKLKRAQFYLDHNQAEKTVAVLQTEQTRHAYLVTMMLAKAAAMREQPEVALFHFKQAYREAQTATEKKSALLQMVKMLAWLNRAKEQSQYLRTLQTFNLSAQEQQSLQKMRLSVHTTLLKPAPKISHRQNSVWQHYEALGEKYYASAWPFLALKNFKWAAYYAHSMGEKKRTWFYILRTANWLQNSRHATQAYQQLSGLPLNAVEKKVLAIERAKTLINLDYMRQAIALLRPHLDIHLPESYLLLAKAYVGVGWPYKANKLLSGPVKADLSRLIRPGSYLEQQQVDLDWLLRQTSSRGMLNGEYWHIQDSTQFIINREIGEVDYRVFGVNSNTNLMYSQSEYFNPVHYVNAALMMLRQDVLNIHDQWDLTAAAIPAHVTYYNTPDLPAWNPFLWQVTANLRYTDRIALYAYNNNALVETIPALQHNILMNNTEASLILHPWDYVYMHFSMFGSGFSDNNLRLGGAGNLMYQLFSNYGLFAKLRYRGYTNSKYDNPYYFSPMSIQEADLFLILKQRLTATTYLYANGGIGLQQLRVDPQEDLNNQSVYSIDLNLAQRIGKIAQVSLNYSFIQNVFNNLVGPYSQQYYGVSLKLYLD